MPLVMEAKSNRFRRIANRNNVSNHNESSNVRKIFSRLSNQTTINIILKLIAEQVNNPRTYNVVRRDEFGWSDRRKWSNHFDCMCAVRLILNIAHVRHALTTYVSSLVGVICRRKIWVFKFKIRTVAMVAFFLVFRRWAIHMNFPLLNVRGSQYSVYTAVSPLSRDRRGH